MYIQFKNLNRSDNNDEYTEKSNQNVKKVLQRDIKLLYILTYLLWQ